MSHLGAKDFRPTLQVLEEQRNNIQKGLYGDSIVKSEGSRGGKVIGHTKSGKPIYANNIESHKLHHDFSEEEHSEAASLLRDKEKKTTSTQKKYDYKDQAMYHERIAKHKKEVKEKNQGVIAGPGNESEEEAAKMIEETTKLQREKGTEGKVRLNKSVDSDDLKKAFETLGLTDLIEKAEGSRGGKVIGHTKSGKPIYARGNGNPKSSSQYHLKKESDRIHKEWEENHKDYTKEDHEDAAKQLYERGKKNDDQKLLIEASNHKTYASSKK